MSRVIRIATMHLLLVAAVAVAQDGNQPATPDSPEKAAVRQVGKAFWPALYGDDFEALRATYGGSKEHLDLLRSWQTAMRAARATTAALNRKFPPPPDHRDPLYDVIHSDIPAKYSNNSAEINITRDTANIEGMLTLRKIDGAWKVTEVGPSSKKVFAQVGPMVMKAAGTVLIEMDRGDFKTRDDAEMRLVTLIIANDPKPGQPSDTDRAELEAIRKRIEAELEGADKRKPAASTQPAPASTQSAPASEAPAQR